MIDLDRHNQWILKAIRRVPGRASIRCQSPTWNELTDESSAFRFDHESMRMINREIKSILDYWRQCYSSWNVCYEWTVNTAGMAIWMTGYDAVELAVSVHELADNEDHRAACRLMRCAMEAADLSYALRLEQRHNKDTLVQRWHNNQIIAHSRSRETIKKYLGHDEWDRARTRYELLSKWLHNSKFSISNSYAIGAEDRVWNDSHLIEGRKNILGAVTTTKYQMWWLFGLVIKYIHRRIAASPYGVNRLTVEYLESDNPRKVSTQCGGMVIEMKPSEIRSRMEEHQR